MSDCFFSVVIHSTLAQIRSAERAAPRLAVRALPPGQRAPDVVTVVDDVRWLGIMHFVCVVTAAAVMFQVCYRCCLCLF